MCSSDLVYIYIHEDSQRSIGGSGSNKPGTLYLSNNLKVTTSNVIGESVGNYKADRENNERIAALQSHVRHAWISVCDHSVISGYTASKTGHKKVCRLCYSSNINEEKHAYDENHKCTVCGYVFDGTLLNVSFAPGGGSGEMQPVQVVPDVSYSLPECAFTAPESKTFDTWSVKIGDAEPVDAAPGKPVTVTADTAVTAKWRNLYTVIFDSDGGTMVESQLVGHGDKAEPPERIYKEGFALKGWELQGAGGADLYDFETPVTDSIILKAVWTDQFETIDAYGTNEECTLTIGRTEVLPGRNNVLGSIVTVTASAPKHYILDGWYPVIDVDASGQVRKYDKENRLSTSLTYAFTVEKSEKITAVWWYDFFHANDFQVDIDERIVNGVISISGEEVYESNGYYYPTVGSMVDVTITPDEGYWLDTLYYTYESEYTYEGETITETHLLEIDPDENGEYHFAMPAYDLTLYATFDNQEYSLAAYTTDTSCFGPAGGAITVSPELSPGRQGYRVHEFVTVTVEPSDNDVFLGWYPVTSV